LPVGIATALAMSLATVVTTLLSYGIFEEAFRLRQLALMVLILFGVFILGSARSTGTLPKEYHLLRGVVNCILFGFMMGTAFVLVGFASRLFPPFIVGYLWEFIIGIIAVLIAVGRGYCGREGFEILSGRNIFKVVLYSSPTVVGTGAFVLATTMGPMGIVTAISAMSMVFGSIFARLLYGEKLSFFQWIVMILICAMVGVLRLFSD
jgi:drug/metabolite transporter (DMT)-like permease